MSILDDIIAHKKTEVQNRKRETTVAELEKKEFFSRGIISLKQSLLKNDRSGIIAEFKRRSPSKGMINEGADVLHVAQAYVKGGASALSILTDESFFGGREADLTRARVLDVPILRKDFIIDEFQIFESRAMGADLILLIAACLSPSRVQQLARLAKSLELEVLLELHGEVELAHICDEVDLIGINNRNLKTFEVDIERSLRMAEQIPPGKVAIAESGITDINTIRIFKEHGFKGFLIGEYFMKDNDPGEAFRKFVDQLSVSKV